MAKDVAEEHYTENSQPSDVGLDLASISKNCDENDLWDEDGSSWEHNNEGLDKSSDLDREWQRRRNEFHTIGYRDGLTAGQKASAQEGFNIGFKKSVFVGQNWGLVRGVTSGLACLPDGLKERLVETQEKRNKFQHLYESVNSLSTTDAMKLFYDELMSKSVEQSENVGNSLLRVYSEKLQVLVLESPAIKVHSQMDNEEWYNA